MELKIQEYKVPESIDFNFDELKSEVAERISHYKTLVYTESEMREAKADRAKLRKVIDAIESERKRVKADLLQPYTLLEQKLDEIKALIQEPINMIDNQVKAYEELQKQTKHDSIYQGWQNLGCPFSLETIWNPKWLNTTYSMKKITDEMKEAIQKWEEGMETLEKLDEYAFEAIEVFKSTLDLGQAMVCANNLKEQARRKAEYEAQKAAVAEVRKAEEVCKQAETEFQNFPQTSEPPIRKRDEPERKWITFTANMTYDQVLQLEEFFTFNHIEFRKGV